MELGNSRFADNPPGALVRTSHKPVSGQSIDVDSSVATRAFPSGLPVIRQPRLPAKLHAAALHGRHFGAVSVKYDRIPTHASEVPLIAFFAAAPHNAERRSANRSSQWTARWA